MTEEEIKKQLDVQQGIYESGVKQLEKIEAQKAELLTTTVEAQGVIKYLEGKLEEENAEHIQKEG